MTELTGFVLIALLAIVGAGLGLAIYDALTKLRVPVSAVTK